MDDRNGEIFEHHDSIYTDGTLNTSDSEHDCLKDFLLEPRSAEVPSVQEDNAANCAEPSDSQNHGELSDSQNCAELSDSQNCAELSDSQNCAELSDSQNCTELSDSQNCTELSDSQNCTELSDSQNCAELSDSQNCAELSDSQNCAPSAAEREQNGSYSSPSADNDEANGEGASETVQNDKQSTKCSEQEEEEPKATRGRKRKGGEAATRGRPPGPAKKKKQPVTYHSQISPDQNGIKLRIKKSSGSTHRSNKRKERGKKRKSKKDSTTDDEVTDPDADKRVRWKDEEEVEESGEQSEWGLRLPVPALYHIFWMVTQEEGCLPFLVKMTRVCRLWRDVALTPSLWHNIDLSSPCIKDRYKTSETVRWLCENRFSGVQELNVGIFQQLNGGNKNAPRISRKSSKNLKAGGKSGWKFSAIQCVLETICRCCTELRGINMTGWKGLNADHLKYLLANTPHLARLDLSSINPESNSTKSAISPVSIMNLTQTMGDRLTHLTLANNKLTAIPQLITSIATHCPNLQVLDLSNLRTVSHSTATMHIEKLQEGCQKLRVLRITNSQIVLSTATLKEQVASPGFPALEELSVAGFTVDGFCSTPVMDDNAVERILKTSHKLRLLDVRGCSRISDSSLVRVPAWDLEHLFLSGCYVTRLTGSGLELIAQKWSHSLVEVDLAWSTATQALDLAVSALAERKAESPLRILNLCGSSVSLNPVKAVLLHCPQLTSLNLSSCRALPRGMKRLYEGQEVNELRSTFEEKPEPETPPATQHEDEPAEPADNAATD